MKVRVEFQAYLDQYSPTGDNEFTCEAPEGSTIADLLQKYQVPPELSAVLVVGENAANPDHVLAEGERVTVIPPVAGG